MQAGRQAKEECKGSAAVYKYLPRVGREGLQSVEHIRHSLALEILRARAQLLGQRRDQPQHLPAGAAGAVVYLQAVEGIGNSLG